MSQIIVVSTHTLFQEDILPKQPLGELLLRVFWFLSYGRVILWRIWEATQIQCTRYSLLREEILIHLYVGGTKLRGQKEFLFQRRYPFFSVFHFMAMVLFSIPKPKLWQFCLLTLWALNTRGTAWCQLTMGAGIVERTYGHCAEARWLEILSTKQVVALFLTDWGKCSALVFFQCPQHWLLERKLLITW